MCTLVSGAVRIGTRTDVSAVWDREAWREKGRLPLRAWLWVGVGAIAHSSHAYASSIRERSPSLENPLLFTDSRTPVKMAAPS